MNNGTQVIEEQFTTYAAACAAYPVGKTLPLVSVATGLESGAHITAKSLPKFIRRHRMPCSGVVVGMYQIEVAVEGVLS